MSGTSKSLPGLDGLLRYHLKALDRDIGSLNDKGMIAVTMLPSGFPPMTTVQRYFYAWRDSGVWQTINPYLLMDLRVADMPATSSRTRSPKSEKGHWKSSNDPTRQKASSCCHGDGSSSGHSPGSTETVALQRTSSTWSKAQPTGYSSPPFNS
jgi:hypothetical protein